jgi:hypothetical protein
MPEEPNLGNLAVETLVVEIQARRCVMEPPQELVEILRRDAGIPQVKGQYSVGIQVPELGWMRILKELERKYLVMSAHQSELLLVDCIEELQVEVGNSVLELEQEQEKGLQGVIPQTPTAEQTYR